MVNLKYIYSPQVEDPDSGIELETAFGGIPEEWEYPNYLVSKEDFEIYDEG